METFSTQQIQEALLPKNDEIQSCQIEKEKSKLTLKILPFDFIKKTFNYESNGQPRNKKKQMELIKNTKHKRTVTLLTKV